MLDCANYISTFMAVIIFRSKKQISGLKNQSKNNMEGRFLLGIWEKMRLPEKKGRQRNWREMR